MRKVYFQMKEISAKTDEVISFQNDSKAIAKAFCPKDTLK